MMTRRFSTPLVFVLLMLSATLAHGQTFTEVAVGKFHLCGLLTDGSVDCRTAPHSTRYDSPDNLPELTAITAGHGHTCGIDTNGQAVCWGSDNYFNELDVPSIDQPLVSIAAGVHHTCAVDASNRLWCWGLNTNGQVDVPGDGLDVDGAGFTKVNASARATCAIRVDGGVSCWGDTPYIIDATDLSGSYTDIAVGEYSACGLQDTGDILCWREFGFDRVTEGPYTDIVNSIYALCGLDVNQQIDCNREFRSGGTDAADYASPSRFTSLVSGNFDDRLQSNICGVTVEGAIECLASAALPDVPGTPEITSPKVASLDIDLGVTVYGANSMELFWTPQPGTDPTLLFEIYRNDELVTTTNASFSYYDNAQSLTDELTYKIRPIDTAGNVGSFSNEVTVDTTTLSVTSGGFVVDSPVTTPAHTVTNIRHQYFFIRWDGSTAGDNGLKGYEIRIDGEPVGFTEKNFFVRPSLDFGECHIVSIAAISEDNTIIDYASTTLSRRAQSNGGCYRWSFDG